MTPVRTLVITPSLAAPPSLIGARDTCPVGVSEPSLASCLFRAHPMPGLPSPILHYRATWRLRSRSPTVMLVVIVSRMGGRVGGGGGGLKARPPHDPDPKSIDPVVCISSTFSLSLPPPLPLTTQLHVS